MVDTDKFASLSNEEYYALTGTLTPARIEELLKSEELAEGREGILVYLDEASASYPEDDFLEGGCDQSYCDHQGHKRCEERRTASVVGSDPGHRSGCVPRQLLRT